MQKALRGCAWVSKQNQCTESTGQHQRDNNGEYSIPGNSLYFYLFFFLSWIDDKYGCVYMSWINNYDNSFLSATFFLWQPSWRHTSDHSNDTMIAFRQSDMKWKPEKYSVGVR